MVNWSMALSVGFSLGVYLPVIPTDSVTCGGSLHLRLESPTWGLSEEQHCAFSHPLVSKPGKCKREKKGKSQVKKPGNWLYSGHLENQHIVDSHVYMAG